MTIQLSLDSRLSKVPKESDAEGKVPSQEADFICSMQSMMLSSSLQSFMRNSLDPQLMNLATKEGV